MSNAVFPVFPGLSWGVKRAYEWSTTKRNSTSGRSFHLINWSVPIVHYRLSYEVLRGRVGLTEMQTMAAFFNQHYGDGDTWLYEDPNDNACTIQAFGVGDGATTSFQLVRAFGGHVGPVYEPNVITQVRVAGSVTTAYTLGANGVITFTVPPALGATIDWTGTFRYRCVFKKPELEFDEFMKQFFSAKTVEFRTWKP